MLHRSEKGRFIFERSCQEHIIIVMKYLFITMRDKYILIFCSDGGIKHLHVRRRSVRLSFLNHLRNNIH